MPRIEIVCLANSRKLSQRCVAGIRTDGGGWVRPVSRKSGGALSEEQATLNTGRKIRQLDIVDIEVVRPVPEFHQPENWLIANRTWTRVGTCDVERLAVLFPLGGMPDGLLLGSSGDRVLKGDLDERPIPRSLDIITPSDVIWIHTQSQGGRPQVRARFEWHGVTYNLPVTDPLWESKFSAPAEDKYRSDQVGLSRDERVILTISLGEPMNGYCYKLVAGVLAFEAPAIDRRSQDSGSDAGTTLLEITLSCFGVAFAGPGRFGQNGWTYEGASEWPCPTCGVALHVARKPYESAGKTYRYWALLCPRCRRTWAPEELDPDIRMRIYRSSPGITPVAPTSAKPPPPAPHPTSSRTIPPAEQLESVQRCSHGLAKRSCDYCGRRRSSRGERAFRENQTRILSGETFRARKTLDWSLRRKRK